MMLRYLYDVVAFDAFKFNALRGLPMCWRKHMLWVMARLPDQPPECSVTRYTNLRQWVAPLRYGFDTHFTKGLIGLSVKHTIHLHAASFRISSFDEILLLSSKKHPSPVEFINAVATVGVECIEATYNGCIMTFADVMPASTWR